MKFDLLLRHAADLGLDVEYADLGRMRHGEYHDEPRLIVLNWRLTQAQLVSACAHELGHAVARENATTARCHRADEYGAPLVISVPEYVEAEATVGEHPGALAEHLCVTRRLVLGWRRWYQRVHGA